MLVAVVTVEHDEDGPSCCNVVNEGLGDLRVPRIFNSARSEMNPGRESSFKSNLVSPDSIATTCVMVGLDWAAAWVQKSAIWMNLNTSSSG
jgi:hypothetical protein